MKYVHRTHWLRHTVALLYSITVLCSNGLCAPAASADIGNLLPNASQAADWTPKGLPKLMTGTQIYDYMDGAGEIPIACGYKALVVQDYSGKAGGTITIEFYFMGTSENAFGLYSMKRLPAGHVVDMGQHSASVQAQAGYHDLLFHKGRYTALLFGDDSGKAKDANILKLGEALIENIKEQTALPDLLRLLPQEGYLARSAKYFHGKAAMDTVKFARDDVFRLNGPAEVATATYSNPQGKLIVIRYGSPGEAAAALSAAQKASELKGFVFMTQGRVLGGVWGTGKKPANPALVARLKHTLQKPGPMLEGNSAGH